MTRGFEVNQKLQFSTSKKYMYFFVLWHYTLYSKLNKIWSGQNLVFAVLCG